MGKNSKSKKSQKPKAAIRTILQYPYDSTVQPHTVSGLYSKSLPVVMPWGSAYDGTISFEPALNVVTSQAPSTKTAADNTCSVRVERLTPETMEEDIRVEAERS